MMTIPVHTKVPYEIYLGEACLHETTLSLLGDLFPSSVVMITDDTVAALYGESLLAALCAAHYRAVMLTVPIGEAAKTRDVKADIEDQLCAHGANRSTVILALGGGAVCDLAGFVAATYFRGIPVIYLPTTLLAMVDAAIGGKVAVNTPHGKNTIGAFKQPHAVVMDVSTLTTLDDRHFRYAFSEMIKHALIADPAYFERLSVESEALLRRESRVLLPAIARSCEIKASIVCRDETEQGVRETLNAGHSVAHAVEAESQFSCPHGLAVAAGLLIESQWAVQQGYLMQTTLDCVAEILSAFIPEVGQFETSDLNRWVPRMRHDKKNRGTDSIRLILITDIGKTQAVDYQVSLSGSQ